MKFLGKNDACIMRIDDGFKKIKDSCDHVMHNLQTTPMGTWKVIATAFL